MHATQSAVVAVTGGILASVFIAALLALLFICRYRLCANAGSSSKKEQGLDVQQDGFHVSRSDIHLISSLEMEDGDYIMDSIDPEDLVIHPDLDKVLESHRWKWVDDALGIVPHCLQMLKGCHLMSERLVTTAMVSTEQQKFVELAMVAKSVLPLVDDVLRSMCPPIQPRGVENRAAALLRGVNRLGSLTEQTCNVSWPSGILDEMNMHYQKLKAIARRSEIQFRNEQNLQADGVTIVESCMT
ncbi:transmembrane protein 98 [Daphnia magna]|uniref:transmembrane protein 98 n=1 Tax=Daphnia magna TaxID=35525 RepID=UPI0006E00CCE|nr:transmembrane protein 98 [Daphnia magna]